MLNKALLLAASQSGKATGELQPYSRFKMSFGLDDGEMVCAKVGDDEIGTFSLLSGTPLEADFLGGTYRVIFANQTESDGTVVPLMVVGNLPTTELGICWVVNETTGQTLYGAFVGENGFGYAFLAWTSRQAVIDSMGGDGSFPNPPNTMFTEADVGKEFTLSLYIEGYNGGSVAPYSQYDVTVGCDDEPPTAQSFYGAGDGDGDKVGVIKHVSGESLAISSPDGTEEVTLIGTILGGINYFTFPLDATASAPGIVKYVDEANGNEGYGVYGVAEDSLLGDGSVMGWFASREDAQTFIETGSTDHVEVVSAPLFAEANIGETHRISFYLDGDVSPYSRFSVIGGKDPNSSNYGYGEGYGSFNLLEGNSLDTDDGNGSVVTIVRSVSSANYITCPMAETKSGICKVVNETTGETLYGCFGEGLRYTKPYYFLVAFKTYEDVKKFLNSDFSMELGEQFFTTDNVGVEQVFSLYIVEYLDSEGSGSGGGSEPEPDHPIPTGTHTFEFKASANASNVNFFTNVSSKEHPTTAFKVSINGEETSQSYQSLSFSKDDIVKITGTDVISFPLFSARSKNYIAEVIAPLPFMSDSDGNGYTSLDYTFYSNGNLTTIPSNIFEYNPDVVTLSSTFGSCKLSSLHEDTFTYLPNLETIDHAFLGCSFTSLPADLFANNQNLKSLSGAFQGCRLTSVPESLFSRNTKMTSFTKTFAGSRFTTVPENLFANNTEVTSFYWMFWQCSNLTTVPERLFANNTKVTDFGSLFESCTSLTSVPENLFANCPEVTSFYNLFKGCTSLTTIPKGIFANNTKVTSFRRAFSNCSKLSGQIKIGSAVVTNVEEFCTDAGSITVLVPAGSTTETTFRDYAATVTNLTVETY